MNINEILKIDAISLDIKAETKREALNKVCDLIKKRFTRIERQEIIKNILEREKLGSTACEKFVAIPHARLDFIDSQCCLPGYQHFDRRLGFIDSVSIC